jgi:two-component system response regulator HupR/HoxA
LLRGRHSVGPVSALEKPMDAAAAGATLAEHMDSLEASLLRETMLRHRWNKTQAAHELGLSRVGLRAKLLRHGLEGKAA